MFMENATVWTEEEEESGDVSGASERDPPDEGRWTSDTQWFSPTDGGEMVDDIDRH